MSNLLTSQADKAKALEMANSILERLNADRLTRVPLLYLDELPELSGVYFAATDEGQVLYIGKADDFTQRCNLSQHHKLPVAIEKGATWLMLARVPNKFAWAVEQRLISELQPLLNDTVSHWWTVKQVRVRSKIPKNRQLRLSDDVWIAAEAIARYMGSKSTREGIETALRHYVFDLNQKDTRFSKIWEQVQTEGIEDA